MGKYEESTADGGRDKLGDPTRGESRLTREVIESFVGEHQTELQRMLIGVLRDAQLAQDALQAALTKLIEKGHTTREESRKAWLFRVAMNEALAFRRRAAAGDNVLRRVAEQVELSAPPSDGKLEQEEEIQRVLECLKQLPPEQQQMIQMRIYEDKTFAVIADELGIPLGTALTRMRSALTKLRKQLSR